jgi:hypothetical protein
MAIKGRLKDLSVPDVLQPFALGQKTGCLSVTHPQSFGYIYSDTGRICYASIVNRRYRLGDILVKNGLITQAQLDEAITGQNTQRDTRLGEILVERYQYDRTPQHRFVSHSMGKSLVSIAVGFALQEKKIKSLDDKASDYVAELRGNVYGETTIRNLLRMSSGVKFSEKYDGNDDLANLVVHIPSIERQQQVEVCLGRLSDESERLREIYKRKLVALDALKKSLLDRAFTGEL